MQIPIISLEVHSYPQSVIDNNSSCVNTTSVGKHDGWILRRDNSKNSSNLLFPTRKVNTFSSEGYYSHFTAYGAATGGSQSCNRKASYIDSYWWVTQQPLFEPINEHKHTPNTNQQRHPQRPNPEQRIGQNSIIIHRCAHCALEYIPVMESLKISPRRQRDSIYVHGWIHCP